MTASQPAEPRGPSSDRYDLPDILDASRTRVVFGSGKLADLGDIARHEGGSRVLLVTDAGIVAAGHVSRAVDSLRSAGLTVSIFDSVEENPTTEHVNAAVTAARSCNADFLVGLGGGSSMDCSKGANFLLTNGGKMSDYWGVGKATKPMLASIAVPTTAGTGSEAQSFALISDPITHQKMACGDKKVACRVAILDPELTRTQPIAVAAATGMDAVSHAVETAGTSKKNDVSLAFTIEAWLRLNRSFEKAMRDPADLGARTDMLLGAHLAGAAIEHSMLGAAHACANPLTARLGVTHGVAVGALLPHVVRFNAASADNPYAALGMEPESLAVRVESMLAAAGLPRQLAGGDDLESLLPTLAEEAASQWTARFNPVPVSAGDLGRILRKVLC